MIKSKLADASIQILENLEKWEKFENENFLRLYKKAIINIWGKISERQKSKALTKINLFFKDY